MWDRLNRCNLPVATVLNPKWELRILGTIENMIFTIQLLRETDGRWIANVPELGGVTVYGVDSLEATLKVKALALRVIAEEIERGELQFSADSLHFSIAA